MSIERGGYGGQPVMGVFAVETVEAMREAALQHNVHIETIALPGEPYGENLIVKEGSEYVAVVHDDFEDPKKGLSDFWNTVNRIKSIIKE